MYAQLIDIALDARTAQQRQVHLVDKKLARVAGSKKFEKVTSKAIAYSERHRDQWRPPEYDFNEIQIAQDTEAYLFRAIQKKVNRVIVAGWSFVGESEETVKYVVRRIAESSHRSNKPFWFNIQDTFTDMFRFSNCMWVKARDPEKSSGEIRYDVTGTKVDPVAAWFVLPFETLQFKSKKNGELKKLQQQMPSGESKEWMPRDVIHFYTNRKPGFTVGTPEMFPALDDLALLRRIEENVEDLIEANLFPVFHYKVGTDTMPERYGPDGIKETDVVKTTVEYMPAGGVYVSDHRHEIEAIGSEGRALRIDFYLTHFKNRALSSIGASAIDFGEGGQSNRSTASTISKSMMLDVEAMTKIVKQFIDFYVIREILLEGGYDPDDETQKVSIKFGVIDKEDRRADENQQVQMFQGNVRTLSEVRQALGDKPWTDEMTEDTFYKRYEEPLALLKSLGPGTAASDALASTASSNITPEGVNKEKAYAETQAKQAAQAKTAGAQQGRPTSKGASAAAKATSTNKAKPANQHGARASAKTNRDIDVTILDAKGNAYTITCDFKPTGASILKWRHAVLDAYERLADQNISFGAIADSMSWRLERE